MQRLIGIAGLVVLLGIVFLLSNNKKKISVRVVLTGLGLQFLLGLLLFKWQAGASLIGVVAGKVETFLALSEAGSKFVFGNLGDPSFSNVYGFQFAFAVLPVLIFFSAFIAILYYLGVMQFVVKIFAWVMSKLMKTSGAESLSCTAEMFVGMTEAPLLIRPFLNKLTMSELCTIMVGGFGTIAGTVMSGYIMMGIPAVNIIIASAMAVPASLMIGKMLYPETEQPETAGGVRVPKIDSGNNLLDAAAKGTTDGLKLALNVAAMLIAFIALIAFVNLILGYFDRLIDGRLLGGTVMANGEYAGYFPGSLRTFFGTIFSPLAYVMGVPGADVKSVGHLLGIKIAVNEFVAYSELGPLIKSGALSEKAGIMATFMLCGFANFSSIGISIGGLSALAPERRSDLARLGLKTMIGGAVVSCLTATIIGIIL